MADPSPLDALLATLPPPITAAEVRAWRAKLPPDPPPDKDGTLVTSCALAAVLDCWAQALDKSDRRPTIFLGTAVWERLAQELGPSAADLHALVGLRHHPLLEPNTVFWVVKPRPYVLGGRRG